MDKALEHLEKTLPLTTPEWSAWSAAMQAPKLVGRWAIVGSQAGKGPIYGQMTVTSDPSAPDSFTTETRYTVARTGETLTRTGKALVYTGYQWRGRGSAAGSDPPWREVMFVERDWTKMWGRWFTGAYDETGIDVKLTRLSSDPVVLGTSVAALKTGAAGQAVRIFGANLPSAPRVEDIGIGPGVKVARIVSARPDEIAVEVDVAAAAPIGARNVSVGGVVKAAALVVYDKIDGIKVLPQAGMARVGGNVFPETAAAVRSGRHQQRSRRQARHRRRSEPRSRDRQVVGRGIHRDVWRRRRAVCRHAGRERAVHAERRRPEPEAQRQPQQHRRRVGRRGAGERRCAPAGPHRCAPARSCW